VALGGGAALSGQPSVAWWRREEDDAGSSFLPGLSFSGRSYLQEIRSALLAASRLMSAVR
jgi:hypothetical protein